MQNVRFSRVKVCIQFTSIYEFNIHFQARQRETSDFYEFYIHCGRPFHLENGWARLPGGICAKSGLTAEMLHCCEAARSASLLYLGIHVAFAWV